MIYTYKYKSPLGRILLAADEVGITGLWFEGQKYFGNTLPDKYIPQETEILAEAKKWLDVYFSGEEPKFTPPLHPKGSTFRQAVWQILLQIPYGQTITYGEIARKRAFPFSLSKISRSRCIHTVTRPRAASIIFSRTQLPSSTKVLAPPSAKTKTTTGAP